ncbi:MAG: hypothetical protein R3E48_11580 [Burkholderiaceae bacterium]
MLNALLKLDPTISPQLEPTSLADVPDWVTERLAIRRGEIAFRVGGGSPLEQVAEREAESAFDQLLNDPIRMTAAIVSASAVWWAARAIGLFTSLLLGAPSWRSVDLLPVVMRADQAPDEANDPRGHYLDDEEQASRIFADSRQVSFEPAGTLIGPV